MRNIVYAALDVIQKVSSLKVAVAAVEADRGGSNNGRGNLDWSGCGRGVWQGGGMGKTERRSKEQCALLRACRHHSSCAVVVWYRRKEGSSRARREVSEWSLIQGEATD